ncbi:MAG: hypothetical protein AB7O62_06740 [Pirellulales bacterium]
MPSLLTFLLLTLPAAAPLTQRAVDLAALPGGERLLGIRLDNGRSPDAQMLVRRAWLEQHAPRLYQRFSQSEAEDSIAAWKQLHERLLAWRQKRADDKQLANYLGRQLAAVEKKLAPDDKDNPRRKEPPSLLLLVRFPRQQIRQQQMVSPARRRLLALAWEHELDDPESLSALELTAQLQEKKIDLATAQFDLSDRVPPQEMDGRQWAAKMALVEYSLLGQPHFQGTGNFLVQAGEGAPQAGLEELLGGLLEGQLKGLLDPPGQPDAPADASDKATGPAEKAGRLGLRITQMHQNAGSGKVAVRGRFLAHMPDGQWQEVWSDTETADAAKVSDEDLQEVNNDPQVAEIMDKLKGLGGGGLLDQALRHGAATMMAQRAIEKRFQGFLLRATRRLDGPSGWNDPTP